MLKQLKLQAELKQRKAELDKLTTRKAGFEQRQADLTSALDEAKEDADIKLVDEQITALENEVSEAKLDESIATVSGEITRIESELADIDERAEGAAPRGKEERGAKTMNYQIRELLKTGAYYERSEVKEFYDKFRNLRAVGGEGLTIPQVVIDRIMDIVGDNCTLYPLVDKIKAKGTARILIDTDTSAATWIEQKAALPAGDAGTITSVDFDGFKIGKVTFVDNCMMQDSIINLDAYVSKKIARAIGLGLDLAILKGAGAASKQPEGVITKLADGHKVTVSGDKLINIVKPIGIIDTGADSVGEIVAVMKRTTYYNRLLEFSINATAAGDVVGKLPNIKNPDLLGLRVVFNNNMDTDKVLYGDFSKYTLVEREDITIDKSEHVKFTEDQTGFRGKGRFDGKPTNAGAFVLVTIEDIDSGELVTFNVAKDADGSALTGATVELCGTTATTDAQGIATFSAVPNGKHNYTVTLTGYTAKSGTVTVADAAKTVNVKLVTA
ncbi:MAG: phage major capsid protein [Angelakisella sp.]